MQTEINKSFLQLFELRNCVEGLSIGSVVTILRGVEVLSADIEAHYGGPFGGPGEIRLPPRASCLRYTAEANRFE